MEHKRGTLAPKKTPTLTRFSGAEKGQMKSGNRTAFVALPKSTWAKRATNNDLPNKHVAAACRKLGLQVVLQSGGCIFHSRF